MWLLHLLLLTMVGLVILLEAVFVVIVVKRLTMMILLQDEDSISIQFIDHLYSPHLSKIHYGRALYSDRRCCY